jgi:hypothetical protein
MPSNSSSSVLESPTGQRVLQWGTIQVDWLYEVIVAEAEVVARRQPNVLEWVLVRILDLFGESAPTLADAATELGMQDTVLLLESLKRLIEAGAVEANGQAGQVDLPNCRITETGREWLRNQPVQAAPERHGLRLCFDGITGEHLQELPKGARRTPSNPVLAEPDLPEQHTHLGLDRARQLMAAQREPSIMDGSLVRDVRVQAKDSCRLWVPMPVELSIAYDGLLEARLENASPAQRQWLEARDLDIAPIHRLRTASFGSMGDVAIPTEQPFDVWLDRTQRIISPASVVAGARELIDGTQESLVLHAAWLRAPEIREAFVKAAGRKVHCRVHTLPAWPADGLTPSEHIEIVPAAPGAPIAVAADNSRAICVDRISLHTVRGRQVQVAVASFVRAAQVENLSRSMVE